MANFDGMYMRPNNDNKGTVPATGGMSSSPDIWIAGTSPLPDYQKCLASDGSYATESSNRMTAGMTNYIYVRAKNGGKAAAEKNATLYYAQSNVIQWPSQWKDNVISTNPEQKQEKAILPGVAPGKVSVCDRPFIWTNTPKPDNGTHFCLIAQLNDEKNSNPFPDVSCALDMAKLVSNNLQWGWRNIETIASGSAPELSLTFAITVPDSIRDEGCEFSCELAPEKLVGFQMAFTCSQADSKGRPITLEKTPIVREGQIDGCRCFLKKGYKAYVTVYLYNDSHKQTPAGARIPFDCFMVTNTDALKAANCLDLQTEETKMRERLLAERDPEYSASNWGMRALVRMGAYTGLIV